MIPDFTQVPLADGGTPAREWTGDVDAVLPFVNAYG